jgi:peptidoglycan/LPS O-acetylase OafA/YrhL
MVLFCTFLGAITYGAYLFHSLVGIPVAEHLKWPGHLGSVMRVSAAVLVTAAVAFPLYLIVEKPCIELGRQLSSKLVKRNANPEHARVSSVGPLGGAD